MLCLSFRRKFNILSYNVNGISNNEKCNKILDHFVYPAHKDSPDIIAFQELKMNCVSVKHIINKLSGYKVFIDIVPGNAAKKEIAKGGIMLAFKKACNFEILDRASLEGWGMIVKFKVNGKMFVFLNVYFNPGTSEEQLRYWEQINGWLQRCKCENVIMVGDFNCSLSRKDNSHAWSIQHQNLAKGLGSFLDKWELQDTWRILHPYDSRFTHRASGHQINSSRIDYVFSSLNISPYITDCEIGPSFSSDHSPLHAILTFDDKAGRGYYKFPTDLCYSDVYRSKLIYNWKQVSGENREANPDTRWDLFKCTINSTAISFKSFLSKCRKEMVESFECRIAELSTARDLESCNLRKAHFVHEIDKAQKDLDNLFADQRKESYARNLARWYSEKGHTTKYFLSKFKKDKDRSSISQLISGTGLIQENSDILKEAHRFYSGIYKKDKCFPPFPEVDEVPVISDLESLLLAEPITEEEMYCALKSMRQSSAPGLDGLTVKFYLRFWDIVKRPLLDSFNFSYETGHLSISQRRGLIRLLPKKNKNPLFIDNWRPISLLNVDYKILTKLFAKRLKSILPGIIHPDQRGFIMDRRSSNGILDLYAIVDLIEKQDEDFLICSIDIRKAFDSVDWDFLRYTLSLFGFPPEFIKWFNVFYSDRTAYVINNNEWSEQIFINKGTFQGCPLSPLLFVLAIEMLACRIRGNNEIEGITLPGDFCKKLNLVADDLLLIFKNSITGCEQVEEELLDFSKVSGLQINQDKSSVTVLGKNQEKNLNVDRLPLFKRNKGPIEYIGFKFNVNMTHLWADNMTAKLDQMFKELRTSKDLFSVSVLERVTVIKSLFFSRLPYYMEKLPLPPYHIIKTVQRELSDVVWAGKKPKMKLSNAAAPPSEGGLGVIDFEKRLKALKVNMISLACNSDHVEFWQQHLFNKFIVPFDVVIKSNINFAGIKRLLKPGEVLHEFWNDCLRCWSEFYYFPSNRFMQDDNECQEVLNRPIAFNTTITSSIPLDKRYSLEVLELFMDKGWFTVADMITKGAEGVCAKGILTQQKAVKLVSQIPPGWAGFIHNHDPLFYTFAQRVLDQKVALKQFYSRMLFPDFGETQRKWHEKDSIVCAHWESLASKVKLFKNVTLRNFFILFNNRAYMLNNVLSKFQLSTDKCTFCNFCTESYGHLFWDCQHAQKIWAFVKNRLLYTPQLCVKETAFFPVQVPDVVVILFTYVKLFIFRCKARNRLPCVKWFKNFMLFHFGALKLVAQQTSSQSTRKFDKDWNRIMESLSK